jgi:hypothetical protein
MSKDYSILNQMKNFREFLKEIHEAYSDFSCSLQKAAKHIETVPNPFPLICQTTRETCHLLQSYCQISKDSISNLKHQIEEYQILIETSRKKQQQIHSHYILVERESCKRKEKKMKEAEVRAMKLHRRFVLYREEIPRELLKEMEENEGIVQNAKNEFLLNQVINELVEQFYQEQVEGSERFVKINRQIEERFVLNCRQLAQLLCNSLEKTHFAIQEGFRTIDLQLSVPSNASKEHDKATQSISIPQIKVPLQLTEKTMTSLLSKLKEDQAKEKRLLLALEAARENEFNGSMKEKFTIFELDLQHFRSAVSVEILSSVLNIVVPRTPSKNRRKEDFAYSKSNSKEQNREIECHSPRKLFNSESRMAKEYQNSESRLTRQFTSTSLNSPIKFVSQTPNKSRENCKSSSMFSPVSIFYSLNRALSEDEESEKDPFQ